jgi:hypothetical protein
MKPIRLAITRDLLLALLVLALAALNFGHQSAVFAAGGRIVITQASVCGDPLAPAAGEHFVCHACRPDAAALPPAPASVEPVCFVAQPPVYAAPALIAPAVALVTSSSPRGPPRAV